MQNDPFDGFTVKVFYDEVDEEWTAYLVELPNISSGGQTMENAIDELKSAWILSKESYKSNNLPIPKAHLSKHA